MGALESTAVLPAAFAELHKQIGVELALDAHHGALRRAAQSAARSASGGAVLVTCSDELQGELRSAFERDVARPICSGSIVGPRSILALSNMAGRLEAGALELAQAHLGARNGGGERVLVVEIMAHCGALNAQGAQRYGRVERGGVQFDCCGVLARVLDEGEAFDAVRHPWREQLQLYLGPERLAALRSFDPATRLLATAVVHALL